MICPGGLSLSKSRLKGRHLPMSSKIEILKIALANAGWFSKRLRLEETVLVLPMMAIIFLFVLIKECYGSWNCFAATANIGKKRSFEKDSTVVFGDYSLPDK
jgi:hypothetical protein